MRHRINRRAFLRYSALGTGAVLAAACGGAPGAPVPTTAPVVATTAPTGQAEATTAAPAAATVPASTDAKYGGTYRILWNGNIPALDPPGAAWWLDWWAAGTLLYNMLYTYDKNYNLVPDLAEDMPEVTGDGTIYTIKLKRGVKFHNGREMMADDVKFTFDHAHWPETVNWGKSYLENIVGYEDVIEGKTQDLTGVKILDQYTIEITLKKPQAVFVPLLTYTHLGVLPKDETIEAGADFGTKVVIGTGPFKFVEWQPSLKVVFERNDSYFKPGLPYLDRIEAYLNIDPAVSLLRWEADEAEFTPIPTAELERVLTEPQFQKALRPAPRMETTRLCIHSGAAPFDDLLVRKAVAHAIDKEALVKFQAGTAISNKGLYARGMLQFDENFETMYPYDPEKAKSLLTQAGYPDGIKGVRMSGAGIGELLQADLKAVGIEAELALGSEANYMEQILSGGIPLVVAAWAASMPDAYDYVSGWCTCTSAGLEGTYNFGQYCNPQVDELLEESEALELMDPLRVANYRLIEDIIINKDVAMIGLFQAVVTALSKEYCVGDVLSGIYALPFLDEAWMDQ